MLTPHAHAFDAAVACVVAILGAPSGVERLTRSSIATWERGSSLVEVDDAEDHVTLTACNDADELRTWRGPADLGAAVLEAAAWLGWALPGEAARAPLDADGAPRSTTNGALGEGDW